MKQYPFVASRIFGTPLLIEPGKLKTVLDAIGDRMGLSTDASTPEARGVEDRERRVAGYTKSGTVAIVQLMGTTVARGGYMDAMSGVMSYLRLRTAVGTALEDDSIRSILLDVSSYGGEAELCGETAAFLREANAVKPITALAHDYIASAAYWLASAAGEVVVTRSAEVGSIGVVMTHMSVEGAAADAGVKITHIHAGSHKVDYSPYFDLSDSSTALMQARIDDLYDQFTGSVAEYRGISQDAVKATEARMFGAEQAVALGLADRIDTFDNVLLQLQRGSAASTEGFVMPNASTEITTVAQLRENFPALCAEIETTASAAASTATEAAVSAERERIAAVQDHAEAEGRELQARRLAFTPGMTAEAAGPILAAAEKKETAAKPAGATEFEKAMASEDPDVAAEAESVDAQSQSAIDDSWQAVAKGQQPIRTVN